MRHASLTLAPLAPFALLVPLSLALPGMGCVDRGLVLGDGDGDANAESQQAYLKAFNAGGSENFGYSLAASGDTLVVGAYGEDGDAASTASAPNRNAQDAGAAYVFVRDAATNTWSQQAYLKASNAGEDDRFGHAVAVSGDTIVVGAVDEHGDATSTADAPNDNTPGTGAAYVFVRDAETDTWSQQAYLKASNASSGISYGDGFGYSVAVSGDTIVVGAYWEDGDAASTADAPNENATNSGAAYVFVRDAATNTWSQQAYLKASNAGSFDNFGQAVAVSGDTLVVGARYEYGDAASTAEAPNDTVIDAGAAYVFVRDTSTNTWSQQAYLKASNPGRYDQFGNSVAVSGDTIVVGALGEHGDAASTADTPNDNVGFAGATYVFVRDTSTNTWSQEAYLKASNVGEGDTFGTSVAVSGDTLIVGADRDDGDAASTAGAPNDNALWAGAAYVFVRDTSTNTWSQQAYLKASNVGESDFFGASVALSDDAVFVGATGEDGDPASTASAPNDRSFNTGAAYVFDLDQL